MDRKSKFIDAASLVTLVVTVVLFIAALFEKGFTHDLLLEAGVFLVSVKLVIAGYKTNSQLRSIDQKLDNLVNRER